MKDEVITNLKLNHHLRKCSRHFVHKFIHKLFHFLVRYTLVAVSEVERVVQELLIVCSEVKANGNGRLWADTIRNKFKQERKHMTAYTPSTSNVQGEFSDCNPHTINPKIAQAKDS